MPPVWVHSVRYLSPGRDAGVPLSKSVASISAPKMPIWAANERQRYMWLCGRRTGPETRRSASLAFAPAIDSDWTGPLEDWD
jgi:hypothetical protein